VLCTIPCVLCTISIHYHALYPCVCCTVSHKCEVVPRTLTSLYHVYVHRSSSRRSRSQVTHHRSRSQSRSLYVYWSHKQPHGHRSRSWSWSRSHSQTQSRSLYVYWSHKQPFEIRCVHILFFEVYVVNHSFDVSEFSRALSVVEVTAKAPEIRAFHFRSID
jgi:hypothetical protein